MATTPSISSTLASAFSSASGGMDVNTLVTQLMAVENQPVDKLTAKQTSYQNKITALGTLKSKMAALQSAAQKLGSSSSSSLAAFMATPSDSTIFSASAGSTAAAGTYSLSVTSLARSQQLATVGQTSSTAAIGTGTATTVTFDFGTISGGTLTNGTYSGATFTSNGSGTQSITIDGTNNTLQGIRDAINAANMGVTATIVNDGSATPYRLALSSNSSGASNSIKITTNGADASIDSLLANNPAGVQHLQETVTAQNASFTVNGIAISKSSNTVSDAIQGVTLTLNKTTTSPATLTVARDTAGVSQAVSNFVTAYNDLFTAAKNSFAYKSGSALAGDATLNSMMSDMQNTVATPASGGTLTHLFDIGITSTPTGTLQIDNAALSSALNNNFSNVTSLFSSATGYATRFEQWSTNALDVTGTFATKTSNLNDSIKSIGNQITALQARLKLVETNYRTQFSALNVALLNMNQTSSYLSQQLSKL
ncbi:MAG TPA: flagellar filament capping protein FliD [Gallionellaceae bacterium]|nr:flagellar filament capping protein FliD [Gallionellaceae bacterium]